MSRVAAYMDNGEEKHTTKTFKYLLYYIDASEKPEAQVTLFGINLIRNSSIFWEPGILQFYLNLYHNIFFAFQIQYTILTFLNCKTKNLLLQNKYQTT